jgi:DNA-binding NarL/FixJ family response regulator
MVLSSHDNEDYIRKALTAGAQGYLLKNTPAQELIHPIRSFDLLIEEGEKMNSKKIKFADLNQNTELLEEIAKEKLEEINGGRFFYIIEGIV